MIVSPVHSTLDVVRPDNKQPDDYLMTLQSIHPEIRGTRAGYVIRFTCPVCATESIIVNKTPRDHYKEARGVSCKNCKSRLTVLTPGIGH